MNNIKSKNITWIKILSLLYLVVDFFAKGWKCYLEQQFLGRFQEIYNLFQYYPMTIMSLIPIILFIIYIFVFHKRKEDHILLTISFVCIALLDLVDLCICVNRYMDNVNLAYNYNSGMTPAEYLFIPCLCLLVKFICSVFYIINTVSRFKYLRPTCVFARIQLICVVLFVISTFLWGLDWSARINTGLYINASAIVFSIINLLLWTGALSNNLSYWKKLFDKGKITEEEYNQKKTEMLEKL